MLTYKAIKEAVRDLDKIPLRTLKEYLWKMKEEDQDQISDRMWRWKIKPLSPEDRKILKALNVKREELKKCQKIL